MSERHQIEERVGKRQCCVGSQFHHLHGTRPPVFARLDRLGRPRIGRTHDCRTLGRLAQHLSAARVQIERRTHAS